MLNSCSSGFCRGIFGAHVVVPPTFVALSVSASITAEEITSFSIDDVISDASVMFSNSYIEISALSVRYGYAYYCWDNIH